MGKSYKNKADEAVESRLRRPRARAKEHAFRLTGALGLRYLEILYILGTDEGDEQETILGLLARLRLFMGARPYHAAMQGAFDQFGAQIENGSEFLRSVRPWTGKLRYPPHGNP